MVRIRPPALLFGMTYPYCPSPVVQMSAMLCMTKQAMVVLSVGFILMGTALYTDMNLIKVSSFIRDRV